MVAKRGKKAGKTKAEKRINKVLQHVEITAGCRGPAAG